MTSFCIISSLETKIKRYSSKHSEKLLPRLKKIKEVLDVANHETKRRRRFVELEKNIVQLSYKIDDAIEAIHGGQHRFLPRLKKTPDLDNLATDLMVLETDIHHECQAGTKVEEEEEEEEDISTNTVPVQEEEEDIESALNEDITSVICISGDSGMGKSGLARKIYDDGKHVKKDFTQFAWVSIDQDFQTKKVLRAILEQLCPDDIIKDKGEIELSQKILAKLVEKKCLVVLEDVEDVHDWQIIRVAFPVGSSSKSKIIITTPSDEVAKEATKDIGLTYKMKPLSEAEWMEIFRGKASIEDDDRELGLLGKAIFHLSGGLPLVAGITREYMRTLDVDTRNQLRGEVDSYRSKTSGGENRALKVCYDMLTHELKPCLVYMGLFPKCNNIEVDKLYLLLSAEGLILQGDSDSDSESSGKTLPMESLRKMLEKLALKDLVKVEEDEASKTRMYKSCRLHDQIRRLCISRGEDEDFFEIVDFRGRKQVQSTSTRRLAVYLGKNEHEGANPFITQDSVKNIRSLLIFDPYKSEQNSAWPVELNDLKEFTQLRVLHFDGIDFTKDIKLPKGIDKLTLLRYVSFRECCNLVMLPSSISKLHYLETLDLRVTAECKMTIPPHIFSIFKRLKHLYLPMVYESDHDKLQLQVLTMLEILINFDTGICNVEDLSKMENLQVLTTVSQGNNKDLDDIAKYLSDQKRETTHLQQSSLTIRNFDCFSSDRFDSLKKLLKCECLHSLHIEGQIGNFPKDTTISSSFTEMIFDGSELEHDPIDALGNLQNLRSLILRNDAFIGNGITFPAASKFPSLKILKIMNLNFVETITFEDEAMPELSILAIKECKSLKEVKMPGALHTRLTDEAKKEDGVYSVEPKPTISDS